MLAIIGASILGEVRRTPRLSTKPSATSAPLSMSSHRADRFAGSP
jgi:hypothetical protein